jgi:3-oxoacyl-[acyl-carrier-protein] synthase II
MAGLATPLDDKLGPRTGCIMGVGLGGLQTLEETIPKVAEKGPESRVSPFFIPKLIGNMLPGEVSMEFGAKGPNTCLATACAAGTHAVGEAMKVIQRGAADIMVCGGAEAVVTPTTLQGFGTAKALSTRNDDPARASRPFDADRDGFVMSEGSGVLILESLESAQERGANIIAEIVGYGLSSDGYHMTAPEPTGNGYIRCMKMALDDAGYGAEDLDYINAHGTSTGLNDATETLAIKTLFGDHA